MFPIGDILTVNCSAHGDQTLRVTWSREYAELPDRRATVRSDGTLIITQLIPEDAGKYFCTASSVGGAIKATADMNVIVVKSRSFCIGQIKWKLVKSYHKHFSNNCVNSSENAISLKTLQYGA